MKQVVLVALLPCYWHTVGFFFLYIFKRHYNYYFAQWDLKRVIVWKVDLIELNWH